MRAFLAAIDRQERAQQATQLTVLVTALRGDAGEIKRLFKTLMS